MTAEIIEGLTGEDTDLMDGLDLAVYFCDIQRLASLLVSPDLSWRWRERERKRVGMTHVGVMKRR